MDGHWRDTAGPDAKSKHEGALEERVQTLTEALRKILSEYDTGDMEPYDANSYKPKSIWNLARAALSTGEDQT